jgi:predicted O-methyltransferase YrrM
VAQITDYLVNKGLPTPVEECIQVPPGYHMFNTGGVEVEVAEFLYALVHMMKATRILETGTHRGISASYMGQAIKEIGGGRLTTLEVIPEHYQYSSMLFKTLDLNNVIDNRFEDSRKHSEPGQHYDIVFLDSEPQYRFDEFLRFWSSVKDNGLILIHDLNEQLGHSNQWVELDANTKVYDWPYGDFREKIGPYITSHAVNLITFGTPRGLVVFQKTGINSEAKKLLLSKG